MKALFWFLEDLGWNLSCRYNFWLHGPYGLSKVVEQMPFKFLIKYLRFYGANIGANCRIEKGIVLHRPDVKSPFKNLIMHDYSFIGHKSIIDLSEKIEFKKFSGIGGYCQLWTHQTTSLIPPCPENRGRIILEENSIIYSGTVISPSVTIGKNSRVGAHSLVNKPVPANEFWGGVPIKKISDLSLKS